MYFAGYDLACCGLHFVGPWSILRYQVFISVFEIALLSSTDTVLEQFWYIPPLSL